MSPNRPWHLDTRGWFNLCFRERLTVSLSWTSVKFLLYKGGDNIHFTGVMVSPYEITHVNRLSGSGVLVQM